MSRRAMRIPGRPRRGRSSQEGPDGSPSRPKLSAFWPHAGSKTARLVQTKFGTARRAVPTLIGKPPSAAAGLLTRLLSTAFVLLLACAAPPQALRAQVADAPPAATPTPDPLAALPADLREKLDQTLEKAAPAKRKSFEQKMETVTAALGKAAGSNGNASSKDLAAAAHAAEDRSLEEWRQSSRQRAADDYRQDPELAALTIEALAATKDRSAAQDDGSLRYTPPEAQPVWTEAVRHLLTPEQLAAWQARVAEEQKDDPEIARFVDAQADRIRENFEAMTKARLGELLAALELPPERAAKLAALGRRAVEQALGAYRAEVARTVRSMPAERRRRVLSVNQGYFGSRTTPVQQEIWKLGLDRLLTGADHQRLRALQDERDGRRARALGRMLVVLMDEKIALTVPQRDRLLGPAEAAVKQEKSLFPSSEAQTFYQFTREAFFQAAAHIPAEAVQTILDPVQWQHWQQTCQDAAGGGNDAPGKRGGRGKPDQSTAEKKEPPLADNPEPEEIERFLSDAFEEKAANERQRELAVLLLKTEDVARVAGLGEPETVRLRVAARGTVEEMLVSWKANLSQNVRSQLENGDPENACNVLASIPDMQFGTNEFGQEGTEGRSIWEKAVERDLTAPQRARWQQEVAARAAFREEATSALILAEFDRRYQLSEAQWEKLRPALQGVMRDYGPDIRRMFGFSPANMPWYFQSYNMFLPLAGIPEDDLKAIIGPDRWNQWSNSVEHRNGVNYWQNIQQVHNQNSKGNNE